MNVAAVLMEILRSAGVRYLFGNPGTTELPFLDALPDSGLEYVLGLQEATAVAAADGAGLPCAPDGPAPRRRGGRGRGAARDRDTPTPRAGRGRARGRAPGTSPRAARDRGGRSRPLGRPRPTGGPRRAPRRASPRRARVPPHQLPG